MFGNPHVHSPACLTTRSTLSSTICNKQGVNSATRLTCHTQRRRRGWRCGRIVPVLYTRIHVRTYSTHTHARAHYTCAHSHIYKNTHINQNAVQ